ncbi:hypothetical protein [Shewanella acanthi]|uniref:hypothetical protein n=1 Tax=Shewanella acanthi TaxID=2864212 RepID=UPI001C66141E|nr:hypothetical protein [Shewanella acanthi]QYJ77675.1 hypothetical protein K0H61_11070 [Shewanella acanthi]
MKEHQLDSKLDKWCKKQAKKLQKRQGKTGLKSIFCESAWLANGLTNSTHKNQFENSKTLDTKTLSKPAPTKKVQRKKLKVILSKYVAKQQLQTLPKSHRKKQLKRIKAELKAANDASFLATTVIKKLSPLPSDRSFALHPYKKSPCKSCPALKGSLCKCALKLIQKRQAS